MVEITCDQCGKKIIIEQYLIDKSEHHFCNAKCKGAWMHLNCVKEKIDNYNCDLCGRSLYIPPYVLNKSNRHFCDVVCKGKWMSLNFVGDAHPLKNIPKSETARYNMSVAAKSKPRSEAQLKHLSDMSANNIGKPQSEEHKRKNSVTKIGSNNPFYDKHHTAEVCEIISNTHIGKPKSDSQKKMMSEARMGYVVPDETRVKISYTKQKRFAEDPDYREVYRASGRSLERRKHISMTQRGIIDEADWPGFVNIGDYCGKWSDPKYKVRKRVRARFDDRCIICGKTREQNNGRHMSVHHVYRKKDACCEGDKVDWLFATLCNECHMRHGRSDEGILKIREIIAIEYGNKCMLSLKEYDTLYPNGSEGDRKWGGSNGH